MPKKKSSTKKTARKTAKKTKPAPQPEVVVETVELAEEHRVLSHLMYIAGLVAGVFAFLLTLQFVFGTAATDPRYDGIKALLLLGWAYFFKTFGHRIHTV